MFAGVHAALAFAWRMQEASVQPSELTQFMKSRNTGMGSGMARIDLHAQAALIRKQAANLLPDEHYAYCVARYSANTREAAVALRLMQRYVATRLSCDRSWLGDVTAGFFAQGRRPSQEAIATIHGLAQSTVSKWHRRVRDVVRQLHYEIDNTLHDAFIRAGLIE